MHHRKKEEMIEWVKLCAYPETPSAFRNQQLDGAPYFVFREINSFKVCQYLGPLRLVCVKLEGAWKDIIFSETESMRERPI